MSHQSTNRNHHPTGGLAAGLAMAVADERLGAPIRQLRNHCAECGRNGGECQTHCQTLRRVCRQSRAQIAFARALVPYHLECFAGNQACQRWDCRLDELVAQPNRDSSFLDAGEDAEYNGRSYKQVVADVNNALDTSIKNLKVVVDELQGDSL